jgi:hypothetical protein
MAQWFTDPTVVDQSIFTYDKGIQFPVDVKNGEYEVGEFNIGFPAIASQGQHDHMFKEIKDSLYSFVCSSCKPLGTTAEKTIDNVPCQAVLYRYKTHGMTDSWTYGITITFPIQDKDNLKKIRKELEKFLKELIEKKLPNLDYSLSYNKRKQKVSVKTE